MKINPNFFGLASAIATSILWVLCSAIVYLIPRPMIDMSGHMVHANLSGMNWNLTFFGFLVGLIVWSLFAGLFAWILAHIYNMFVKE